MKRNLISFVLIALLSGVISINLRADEHSREEVLEIIEKVKKKISILKDKGADEYASYEIFRIEDHINSTKSLLEKGEEDQAYYEMRIGIEYFKLIDARKILSDKKALYEKTRQELEN